MAQRAISGDLLWGSSAMRFIFMDEAGTSENEPVTIVVGLIVNADEQLMFAESAVEDVLGSVPKKFRDGFVFHATESWSSPKYREDWAMADRLELIKAMMALPKRLKLPISLAMVRRSASSEVSEDLQLKGITTSSQLHHIQAFWMCISRADRYIRNHADLKEVGTVACEDVPEMRKFLKTIPKGLYNAPLILAPGMLGLTLEEKRLGYMTQSSEVFRVSRIRRSVHFVQKQDDPLLQLADACAFGFRRYFSEQTHGKDFVMSILGQEPPPDDYSGLSSATTFIPC
jgi:hypothetical protein